MVGRAWAAVRVDFAGRAIPEGRVFPPQRGSRRIGGAALPLHANAAHHPAASLRRHTSVFNTPGGEQALPYQPLRPQEILRTRHLRAQDPFTSTGNFIFWAFKSALSKFPLNQQVGMSPGSCGQSAVPGSIISSASPGPGAPPGDTHGSAPSIRTPHDPYLQWK